MPRLTEPLLSLIIPVYKAEEFIEACLDSVFAQLPDRVEVILVDDGTPDDSIKIVRHKYSGWISAGKLILLEQCNKGPGAARNVGIRESGGAYIAFLDSDDVLLEGYFVEFLEYLHAGVVDLVEFGFIRFDGRHDASFTPYRSLYKFDGLYKLADVRAQVFAAGCWYPSTRVYRRETIAGHLFPEGTHYEDLMTIPFIYLQELTVFFIDKPLLGYRYNPDSITSNHTLENMREKYGLYCSISPAAGEECTKILKIKIARGIVFFYSELRPTDFPIGELIADIRAMQLSFSTRRVMQLPDQIFFSFPLGYLCLDRIRVPVKKLVVRIRRWANIRFIGSK